MFCDINSLLSRTTQKSGIKNELKDGECKRMFSDLISDLLGEELAKNVKPLYVKDACLIIASLSDNAVCQIVKLENTIIEKINKNMGEKYLEVIRVLS